MILLVLLLFSTDGARAQRFQGQQINGSCVCAVNTSAFTFPVVKYEATSHLLQSCEDSLNKLQTQTSSGFLSLPQMEAVLENVTARLQRFQYLKTKGLYHALHLTELSDELRTLRHTIDGAHLEASGAEAENIHTELQTMQEEMDTMHKDDIANLETMKEKLRSISNRVQACRTIPHDFRNTCSQRVMRNISAPVITKLNPFSKSFISGAWGRDGEGTYWIQPLANGHRQGITVRLYDSYEDFMAGRGHRDETIAGSYTHEDAVQGSGTVMHGGVLYYQCFDKEELCAFDVKTKKTRRLRLPDAGINNKFPYCYYSCRDWTDFSISADREGLWVIYATEANHGNLVVSRVDAADFNVTHTWKTRLFKRSASHAFMVCGVMYATRYVDTYREEVFYAFDVSSGAEDDTLSLPLEKVARGVANLHYNADDMRLYMYNDGYLLAYDAYF